MLHLLFAHKENTPYTGISIKQQTKTFCRLKGINNHLIEEQSGEFSVTYNK